MILPENGDENGAAPRSIRMINAVRAWATSEAGTWIIIGILVLVATIGLLATALTRTPSGRSDALVQAAPGRPTVLAPAAAAELTLAPSSLQSMTFDEARAWNETLPYSADPVLPARPFIAPTTDVESYARALDCLTAAIYYEAGAETPGGQAAVAQVVLNRTRHPAYPRTVCGVVFQGSERTTGCQFTFTCDGALARPPSPAGWARARAVATIALNGQVFSPVGTATHYHTDWVAPYWASSLSKIVKIGTHIFYRWKGSWGLPSAFSGGYLGNEPTIAKMAALSEPILIEEPILAPEMDDAVERLTIVSPPQVETRPLDLQPTMIEAPTPTLPPVQTLAEQAAARTQRRDTEIVADPLSTPGERPAPRPRTATPSSW